MAFNHRELINEIQDQYFDEDNNRPWIVAYSGGKDSTTLLQLVWTALERLPVDEPQRFAGYKRKLFVVCNNTMVENPTIIQFIDKQLRAIKDAAIKSELPISVFQTTPLLEDSFWLKTIGLGYPVPTNSFRWCTERLKIKPTTLLIQEKISEYGEAIILIGTRSDESKTRAASIKKHEVKGSRLRNHPLPNAKAWAPIKDMTTDEVWMYLRQVKNPWTGEKNNELQTLYLNASGGDCPLVMDIKTPSCGNSRFGCWTCTVVREDKSMKAQLNNGENWLKPMIQFRSQLNLDRNLPENRSRYRRNGQVAEDEDGNPLGAMNFEYRAKTLKKLLEIQKMIQKVRPDLNLITHQELTAIQVVWNRDLFFDQTVADIYKNVFNVDFNQNNLKGLSSIEKGILTEVCSDEPEYVELIDQLIALQESKSLMISKHGLNNDIERRISQFVETQNNI